MQELSYCIFICLLPTLMNITAYYNSGTNKKIETYKEVMSFPNIIWEAAYMSILAQTAWGLTDIIPISAGAKAINIAQTALSFLITAGTISLK